MKISAKISLHASLLLPFAHMIADFFLNNLTAEPVQEAMHRTGRYTLILLLLTLSCTPLKILTEKLIWLKLRRTFGLYSFFYASSHALIFFAIDYGFDPEFIREALVEKPFALAGLFAYILLVPLALTSNKKSMSVLRKNWKSLHRLIYISAASGILHFFWLVKSDYRMPVLYLTAFALLMTARLYFALRKRTPV